MKHQPVFLYDFSIDTHEGSQTGGMYIYGYLNDKKMILKLRDYEIYADVAIDMPMFCPVDSRHNCLDTSESTANSMVILLKQISYQRGKFQRTLRDSVAQFEFVKRKHFKGMRRECVYSHIRLRFRGFQDYEDVKRALAQFNEQYAKYVACFSQNDQTEIQRLLPAAQTEAPKEDRNLPLIKQLCSANGFFSKRLPFRVSEDDPASRYIFKVQRHSKLQLCGWNMIPLAFAETEDDLSKEGFVSVCGARYYAEVSINSITQVGVPEDIASKVPLTTFSWDIEVSTRTGKFDDNGRDEENRIICICYTVGDPCALSSPKRSVCIVTEGCNTQRLQGEQNEVIQIVTVKTELDMILTLAQHIHDIDPTFITGFNDSSFDWPFIMQKLEMYGGFDNTKMRYRMTHLNKFADIINRTDSNDDSYDSKRYPCHTEGFQIFEQNEVKINAGNNRKGITLKIPGIICVDTRTLLMKDQALEKRSLNDYLSANNLPLKLEVDFGVMNVAYRSAIAKTATAQHYKDLLHIYEYCSYDADACRLLWAKRNILRQILEISRMSFTPVRSGFMNANGVKVRNMVAAFANDLGYSVPMASTSSDVRLRDTQLLDIFEKYPGAYVPEPHKGVSMSPVIALDFASLYPSIIMAHNLSPESVIEEDDVISELPNPPTAAGEVLVRTNLQNKPILCSKVEVEFEQAKRDIKYTLKSYVVSRSESLGVYPQILANLFKMRKEVKAQLAVIEDQIKDKESQHDHMAVAELRFQYSLVDVRQRAIKVFMNTFYGETGNQLSSLFDVVISGGTTSYGQKYIKTVHREIANRDCEVVAGDTDSIYFRPRLSHYSQELQRNFSSSQMLTEGMQIAFRLQREVNAMMGEKTHGILKMEFEEMLCPSIFTGKKKYFGVVYKPEQNREIRLLDTINVKRDALVKGIDFIKSQYPPLIKRAGYTLLEQLLNMFSDMLKADISSQLVFEDQGRHELSHLILQKCTNHTVDLINYINFLKPADYNEASSKKKIRDTKSGEMQGFRKRIKELEDNFEDDLYINQADLIIPSELKSLDIEVPQVGELLDIVYVKTSYQKGAVKASQKMHLLKYAQKKGLDLDCEEYVNLFRTSVVRISMCAFLPTNVDMVSAAIFKKISQEASKSAKNHFSFNNINAENAQVIMKTPRQIQIASDCQTLKNLITYTVNTTINALTRVCARLPTKFDPRLGQNNAIHGFTDFTMLAHHLVSRYPLEIMIKLTSKHLIISKRLDESFSCQSYITELCALFTDEVMQQIRETPLDVIELYIFTCFMTAPCVQTRKNLQKPEVFGTFKWIV